MKPNKKLLACVAHWRSELRLDDWKIAIQEATPGELENGDCRARVDMQAYQREATIILRSLIRFDAATEQEIVHELLHLVLAQYSLLSSNESAAFELPMEQAINAITGALLSPRRSL